MASELKFSPSQLNDFMQETRVDLPNGQSLHVEMGGEPGQPVILLIMGLGAQMLIWPDSFCRQLIARGYRVIRFDNRDIGLSSKVRNPGKRVNPLLLMGRFGLGLKNQGAPYDLYDMADDVAHLIEALQLTSVNVIGASMGGMIAQILAARYPHLVQRLGLLFSSNNQRFLPPPYPRQLLSLIGRPENHEEDTLIRHSLRVFEQIGSPGHLDRPIAAEMARTLYRRSFYPAGMMQQFLAILCTGSLLPIDRQIRQPTIVVHGSRDRLLPPAHGRAIAAAIADASFHLVEGMGHDIQPYFVPQLVDLFAGHFDQTLLSRTG